MKVFFGSTSTKINKFRNNYKLIANTIEELGHTFTSRFIIDFDESFYQMPKPQWSQHYKRVMDDISGADIAVFEVTVSSLAVGQMLQRALMIGKPVIALHTSEYNPILLSGAEDVESRLQVLEYSKENLEKVLKEAIKYAYDWLESRFTMVLNSRIKGYLDQIAQSGISRSDYIRKLITKDMKRRKE